MLTYELIAQDIATRQLRRAYLLSGEEPYFIDKLTELFLGVVPEDEQDFNLTVLYGNDRQTDLSLIMSDAMRFPMMGERHVVVVKEAQQVGDLDKIAPLLEELPETTCLVLAYKKKADKRKGLYKAFVALGSLYESNPISERDVPRFITTSLQAHNIDIDAHSAILMADHTGNNLEKITLEVEKLSIILGGKGAKLTPELIEEHVGISREYNNFELLNALIKRDATKAYRIAYHFAANEKNYPIQMTLPVLFNFFSQLMGAYYLPQRDERSLATGLGIAPYMARDYATAMQTYTAAAVYGIIRQIRLSDAYSKGVDSSLSGGDILKELVSYILLV